MRPTAPKNNSYVHKKKRTSSAAVVYDPKAHRNFVTGFRARKAARRERAIAEAAEQHNESRLEARKERREFLRESRQKFLQAANSDSEGDDENNGKKEKEEQMVIRHEYNNKEEDDGKVTAVVTPLEMTSVTSAVPFSDVVSGKDKEKDKRNENEEKSKKPKLKALQIIGRKGNKANKGYGKRHVSYSHTYHKKSSKAGSGNKKTTHGERRKRQGNNSGNS